MSNLNLNILLSAVDKITAPFKSAAKASNTLSTALKDQYEQRKTLEKQQKLIGAYRELEKTLSQTANQFDQAKTKASQLKTELKNSDNPTTKLTNSYKKAQESVQKLKVKHIEQIAKLKEMRTALQQAGISSKNLSAEDTKLKTKIDSVTKSIDKQKQSLERLNKVQAQQQKYQKQVETLKNTSDKTKEFGQRSMVIGGAVLGTGAAMMKPAVEFEQAFSKVQALTRLDKNSAEDAAKIKALRDQAINLGATTAFTSSQVAEAQGYLAMAGFDTEKILSSISSVLNVSMASGTDLARVSDIMSDISSGFKIPANEMQRVADVLTYTFTTSNTSIETLYETMKEGGPIMSALGQSFESTAAMVGLMGNVGIKGSSAGTALKNIGLNLIGNKHLKKLGIREKDKKGNMRQLPEILAEINKKTAKMGNAARAEIVESIFGKIGIAAALELLSQSDVALKEYEDNIKKKSKNTGEKVAKIMSDNLMGDLKGLDSAREALGITIFDGQSKALRELTQTATGWLRTVNEWIKANPELTAKIVKWTAILSGAAIAVGALSVASSFILYPIARMGLGFLKVGGIVLSLGGKFLGLIRAISLFAMTNPIILAVIAIVAALAGIAYLIYKNWEPLSKRFKEIWDKVKVKFDETKKWFSDLPSDFLKFGEDMITSLKKGIEDKFTAVTNCIKEKVDWIKQKLGFSTEAETKINEIKEKAEQESLQKAVQQFHGGTNILMDEAMRDVLKPKWSGGYAGNGGKYQPKGIYHGGEYIMTKEATSRLGVPLLNALNYGKNAMLAAGLGVSIATAQPIKIDNRTPLSAKPQTSQMASQPMQVNITINAQQGQNAVDIAKEVEKALYRREQQKQARARSALRDRG
ncbi:phage tail tape measure protein [Gallibacterium genomosp. 1]|uniref:Phage tail tape measure protein domain-containing protein n=1 Tax=Gallibacterium genomosp. 1 TaxID=155515 RepID=A0A0A2YHH5_9PAST|nr:phage tail tape measure protein [Gallibacterium genomosp. 1]KGQ36809.1 hypothetical protein JP36_08780 [Gallibacterium genomosp. 1]